MGWIQNRVVAVFSAAVAAASMSFVVDADPAGATDFGPVDPTIADGDTDSLRDILENQISDGDVVILQTGSTYTLDSNSGDIDIAFDVTIQGNGATIRQTVADSRVLDTSRDLTLQNVTITGGREDGDGGGVRADASDTTLTIVGSTLTDNATTGAAGVCSNDGGAIEADGELVIRTSTLSNNSACDDGGAFNHDNEAEATVIASTLSGNCAEDEGGANDSDGNLTMVNSTVTGNTADESGAIDMDSADLTLVYSDVVQNTHTSGVDCPNTTQPAGAGVSEEPPEATDPPDPDDVAALDTGEPSNIAADGDFFVFGSVVALPLGDEAPFNCENENGTTSSGFNFSDDDTCGFTNTAQGDRENAGDPGLAALASNGGPTQTRLPSAGSPLINFIPIPSCDGGDDLAGFAVTDDQRGVSRPQETGCEIGSVEIEPPVPPAPPVPAVPAAAAPTAVPVEPRFTG